MQTVKSESFSDSADILTFNPPGAKAELDYWEHLVFSFDTDRDPGESMADKNTRNTRRSRSASQGFTDATGSRMNPSSQQPDPFSQMAATGSSLQGPSGGRPYDHYDMLAQTLREMHGPQGGYPYIPPAQNFSDNFSSQGSLQHSQPPLPQQNVGWAQQQQQQHTSQNPFPTHSYDHHQPTHQYASGTTQFPNPYIAPPHQQSSPMNMGIQIHNYTPPTSQAGPSQSSSGSPDNNSQGEDGVSISEDKRRRNTAASARFRIKKKQRSLNMERTVSDLTGRAEELEREATELRRENGWLKEIVMLKGRSLRDTGVEGDQDEGDDPTEDDSDESEDAAETSKAGKGKGKKKEGAKK